MHNKLRTNERAKGSKEQRHERSVNHGDRIRFNEGAHIFVLFLLVLAFVHAITSGGFRRSRASKLVPMAGSQSLIKTPLDERNCGFVFKHLFLALPLFSGKGKKEGFGRGKG